MNRFTRWLVVGVFAAGALTSCTDEETTTNLQELVPTITPLFSTNLVNPTSGWAEVNDARWIKYYDPGTSVGSGVIRGFLDMQDKDSDGACGFQADGVGCEQGLNNARLPQDWVYEQARDTYTNDLPLNFVPVFNDPDMGYVREFVLDANEPKNAADETFSIEVFELYLCDDATAPNFNLYSDIAEGNCALVYDISGVNSAGADNAPLLAIDNAKGSGNDFDYRLLIPESKFEAAATSLGGLDLCPYNPSATDCGQYLVLWAAMGREALIGEPGIDYSVADGYEEMSTILRGYVTVEKTAVPSFTRTYSWTIEKSVDVAAHDMFSGETGRSNYDIVVTRTATDGDFKVTGTVTITNMSSDPLEIVSILDEFNGDPIDLDCSPGTIAGGASLLCDYEEVVPVAELSDLPADGTNEVFVELGDGAIFSATVDYTFVGVTPTMSGYETVHVTDDYATSGDASDDQAFGPTSGETATFEYFRDFECDGDAGSYHNIATITETSQSAYADVTVTCSRKPLEVSKTAAGTYDRTVEWTLTKSVDPASHTGFAGTDAGTSTWTVVATKTETLDNYQVTGSIFITNPGLVAQSFTVSDVLDDAGATSATVTCPAYSVDPGATVECTYIASPSDGTATLNTATVTAEGNPPVVATDPVEWTENLIGYDSGTLSDERFDYEEIISGNTTVEFPETFACSGNAADYTNGSYSYTETNTAILDSNIGLSDSKTVEVTCSLDPLDVTKTADGTYDRTVEWTLAKEANPDSHTGLAGGEAGTSTWTVVATKTETLGNYQVTGEITITNPAPFARDFTVTDVLDDGTTATVTCPSYTVPAGGSVVCTYGASPDDDEATLNTATVSSPGNPDQTATDPVEWTENLIGFDSGTLSDKRFDYEETISASTTVHFPETFRCSGDASLYEDGSYSYTETNTAILDSNIGESASATVTVTCTLEPLVPSKTAAGTYDRTVTWDLVKTVSPASHIGVAGDAFSSTWSVVATKTETLDNYQVAGDISIHNPAGIAQSFTVADVLDGTSATVTCQDTGDNTGTVPAGGDVACSYTASTDNDEATLNTATVSAPGNPDQEATAAVGWTEHLIGYDGGTLADGRFGYSNDISASTSVDFDETFTCPTSRDAYDENGSYSYTERNDVTLDSNIGLDAWATVTVDCTAGFVDIYKTTNGVAASSTMDIRFALYSGESELEVVSTLGNGANLSFQTPLVPGNTYAICESPVPAGYTYEITVDGGNVLTYAGPPGEQNPTGEIQCFNFTAAAGTTTFAINNSYPGGAPRTPGYWKNWSTCSGGLQVETAAKLGGVAENVYLLDDLLPQTLGDYLTIETCEDGVLILDSRDLEDLDKKDDPVQRSNDAAYALARSLLAARLNQDAGACTAADFTDPTYGTFEQVLTAADGLLSGLTFTGTGSYLAPQDLKGKNNPLVPVAQQALYLNGIIDDYNNGEICTGTPSH